MRYEVRAASLRQFFVIGRGKCDPPNTEATQRRHSAAERSHEPGTGRNLQLMDQCLLGLTAQKQLQ